MRRVILHSGGLDSTVCLLRALQQGTDVLSLGVDYRQKHAVELEYAERQCARFGVERQVLGVHWDKPVREIPQDRSVEEMRRGSTAFLPGRNAIFLTLACAQAMTLQAAEVWIGINAVDFSGYPDCQPPFLEAFNRMIVEAIPGGPVVCAPLLHSSKRDIAQEAARYGLTSDDTWSCYRPDERDGQARPCRRCDACRLHDLAWRDIETRETSVGQHA